jgi:hypothetical protein
MKVILYLTLLGVSLTMSVPEAYTQENAANHLKYNSIKEVPGTVWEQLGKKKIFFGHQSVGKNIMEGMKDLLAENPEIVIRISLTSEYHTGQKGMFGHDHIGKNENPESKISAFQSVVKKNEKVLVDMAFFKLCFVDITRKTDISQLFDTYKTTMSQLRRQHPDTAFVHFTVPLLKKSTPSLKARVKAFFGMDTGFFDKRHNVRRNEFNQMLLAEYSGKEPVFDLAGIESLTPEGNRESFTSGGQTYYSLFPGYTDDGGHLNKTGRRYVAEQFLLFLAAMI